MSTQLTAPGPTGATREPRTKPPLAVIVTAIVALHAGALFVAMHARPDLPKPVEPPVIMAELLTVAPVAVPAAIVPAPTPTPPVPRPTPVRKVEPRRPVPPVARPTPAPSPEPSPVPMAPPTPTAVAAPAPPPGPAPAQPAPAETLAATAPTSVQSISCTIDKPAYPSLSRKRDETGTTIIMLTVDQAGAVESATVRTSSGAPLLDAAARSAALGGRCKPYIKDGHPIRATTLIPFKFTLDD